MRVASPRRRAFSRLADAALLLLPVSPAEAEFLLVPDTVCAPTDDVCVIDRPFEVSRGAPLDFGRRTVVVRGEGRLSGSLALACGSFISEVDGTWVQVTEPSAEGYEVDIVAQRGCSLDATAPCLVDSDCGGQGLGVCTAGSAGIVLAGRILAPGADVRLVAADDIALGAGIDVRGVATGDSSYFLGRAVQVRSFHGSVEVLASLLGDAAFEPDFGVFGAAADVVIMAARDVAIRQPVYLRGGDGQLVLDAGRDVVLAASLLGSGAPGSMAGGAGLFLDAGRDVRIAPAPGQDRLLVDLRGGTLERSGTRGAGAGGSGDVEAARDLLVGEGVRINTSSGRSRGEVDDLPYAGTWRLRAGHDLGFDGALVGHGRGRFGVVEEHSMDAGHTLRLGPGSRIRLKASYVDGIEFVTRDPGPISLAGVVDLRAPNGDAGGGEPYGEGGRILVRGGDLDVSGTLGTGGGGRSGEVLLAACRLDLAPGARIDLSYGAQAWEAAFLRIDVREGMTAAAGSEIAAPDGASMTIFYREGSTPPLLQGVMPPGLEVVPDATLAGCPGEAADGLHP